jgi:hypothetical protein
LSPWWLRSSERRGPLDGEWYGVAADTRLTLMIDQTEKPSSGDHLIGTGEVSWTAADGTRQTDPLLVDGMGLTHFTLVLRRNISYSAGRPLQSLYYSGTLAADDASTFGTLDGDDQYGLAFDAQQLILSR